MGLQQFEERLGRLMDGALTRPFKKTLQPVEIARKLTREMDLSRRVSSRTLISPNRFAVHVATTDAERFLSFADALSRELVVSAKEHAQTEGYSFIGPVSVEIFEDPDLKSGDCDIEGSFDETASKGVVTTPDGRRTVIEDREITIGRIAGCDVVVNDTNVSRRHASVARSGDQFIVTDLGSTNGTLLNGRRIQQSVLQAGDVLTVGTTKLTFETA